MFESLPGFRDFYPGQYAVLNHILEIWKKTALCCGFVEYDTPLLEPLELFTEKSGEEIVGQLFAFSDKGGRKVALRPEMTPSLARLVGAKAQSLKKPVKWFNVGEHFRYERPQKGRTRSFYQLNADILGEPGPGAEVELIALLLHVLRALGLEAEDVRVHLSDRDLWVCFLESHGLREEQITPVLGIIDKLRREKRSRSLEKLRDHLGERGEDFLEEVEKLVAVSSLEALGGFFEARPLPPKRRAKLENRLRNWDALLSDLGAMELLSFIEIDLGIVRGLAYYTGFVFEAFERTGKARSIAGGGRYDHLVEKLGYNPLSATGFAMGDVVLSELLEEKKRLPERNLPSGLFVIHGGERERKMALRDIAQLRNHGFAVQYALKEAGFGRQFKTANQIGARLAVIYGEEELKSDSVKVRDLLSGKEIQVRRAELVESLERMLGSE